MNQSSRKKTGKEPVMRSQNFLAILALVAEMAKRVNENIGKVQLKPLGETASDAARLTRF